MPSPVLSARSWCGLVVSRGEVPPRIGDDRQPDHRDDEHHHGAEGVESQADFDPQLRHPRPRARHRLAVDQTVEVGRQPPQRRQRGEGGDGERPPTEPPADDGQGDADDAVQQQEGDQQGAPLVVDRPRGVIQSAG